MAMDRPPSLTTRCVLHAVRLQCVLRCRSKWWVLHKTLVRTTGSIVKLSLKPLFHGLFGIAASQLCDAFITQLPFLVHREGLWIVAICLRSLTKFRLKPNTSVFFIVVNYVQ